MISLTAIGVGGLVAAIAAGWQQVKNVWSYVSSFAFVKVSYDSVTSQAVHNYLKAKGKRLPSGQLIYASVRMRLHGRKNDVLVPFRMLPPTSVYIHSGTLLFTSFDSDGRYSMRAIRGFINFDNLVKEATDLFDNHVEILSQRKTSSRYRVIKVIGSEKTPGIDFSSRRNNQKEEAISSLDSSPGGIHHPDTALDTSFKYAKELYTIPSDESPLDGLFFSKDILEYFDQAQKWYELGDWYLERKIPWRRGWLMHGPGGTGKSSIAKAVSQKLDLPVYQFYLGTLSDQEFMRAWDNMNTPCVALFEDFDAVFHGRISQTEHKSLTFDCVLNQISGVAAMNGVFLIVTTNHLEHIDPAMGVNTGVGGLSTRPGRIDTVIEVSYINEENRRRMAEKILVDWPDLVEKVMVHYPLTMNFTPVQWQEICIQAALHRMAGNDDLPPFDVERHEAILKDTTVLVGHGQRQDLDYDDSYGDCETIPEQAGKAIVNSAYKYG